MQKSLLSRIYESLIPEVEVNETAKTFEIVNEGFFFEHITRTYFTFKGYRQVYSE